MTITVGGLHTRLCSHLKCLFENFVAKCRRCGVIQAYAFQHIHGPGWQELEDGPLSFIEQELLCELSNQFYKDSTYDDSELPLILTAIESISEAHGRRELEKSLKDRFLSC